MAKRIEVSPAYLSQIEVGKLPPPTFNRIEKIAEVFGIPSASLLDMSDRLNPEIKSFLNIHPELGRFIQFAGEIGFESKDFRETMTVLGELGLKGFRNLLRHGRQYSSNFKSSGSAQFSFETFQKYQQDLKFREFVKPELVFPDLDLVDKEEVLRFLVDKSSVLYPSIDSDTVFKRLMESEKEATSGIGNGVAIPHLFLNGIEKRIFSMARITKGIDFNAVDDKPVYLVCLILDTEKDRRSHLDLLAYLARQFQNPGKMNDILEVKTREQLISLVYDLRPPSLN